MHAKPFLIPAAAGIFAMIWLTSQRRELTSLETSNATITAAIARARAGDFPAADEAAPQRPRADAFRSAGAPDWKKIAQASLQSAGPNQDMRAMVALQTALRDFSTAELLAGIEEIRAMDLPDGVKRQLESGLISVIVERDPQLALERFADTLRSGQPNWNLSGAIGKWSAKDPAAATAWMDARIADGTFDSRSLDGKNLPRLLFEASLIENFLASDPAAAAARLQSLPEDQRAEVFFHGGLLRLKPGQAKPTADLIRSHLPDKDRLPTLGKLASPLLRQGGLPRVAETLREIEASPAERAGIVGEAARETLRSGGKTIADFEETRAWIAAEAPADAGRLTGHALAHITPSISFAEAAKLALQEQQASGNDEALVAFLRNVEVISPHEFLEVTARVTDPATRATLESPVLNNPNREP
jgi:hypothetical protein